MFHLTLDISHEKASELTCDLKAFLYLNAAVSVFE
jgi:hypothetical protein